MLYSLSQNLHDFKSRIKYILQITNSPQFTFRYYGINYDDDVSR